MIFEALVKFDDNKNDSLNPQDRERKLFQQGDIVVIRPQVWQWGKLESKEFLIVPVDIPVTVNPEFYEMPIGIITTKSRSENKRGKRNRKQSKTPASLHIVKCRRFAVDVKSLLQTLRPDEREMVLNKEVDFQPFRQQLCTVIDKFQRSDIQQRIQQHLAQLKKQGYTCQLLLSIP